MVKTRSLLAIVAVAAMMLLAACASPTGGADTGSEGPLIGVAMPTSSQRWIADGTTLTDELEAEGFSVTLRYADDDIPTQVSQVESMITAGAKALIIAAIDSTTLTNVLQRAADAGIRVIAYDRLIRDTENVDYYVSFDNVQVGRQQAWSLVNGLGLTQLDGTAQADAPPGPFTIELFAGSLDDGKTSYFFAGAMDVLQPLIEDGTLVVRSGQTGIEQAATLRGDPQVARARMAKLLTGFYSDGGTVDAVLSPDDGLSRGIISALIDDGYSVGDDWPIISGQYDAEVDSMRAILSGEQYATVFTDTRELAKGAAALAIAAIGGDEPELSDTERYDTVTYDNGVIVVPSYLLRPVPVTKDNVRDVLGS